MAKRVKWTSEIVWMVGCIFLAVFATWVVFQWESERDKRIELEAGGKQSVVGSFGND